LLLILGTRYMEAFRVKITPDSNWVSSFDGIAFAKPFRSLLTLFRVDGSHLLVERDPGSPPHLASDWLSPSKNEVAFQILFHGTLVRSSQHLAPANSKEQPS